MKEEVLSLNLLSVREALDFGSKNGGKPLFGEATDPAKWDEIRTSEFYTEERDAIKASAEKYRKVPISVLPYSLYKIYDETGSRFEYENAYFDRRGRLNTFAGMSLIFGEKNDLHALEDILWAICDEYTWCLPAHLGGKSTRVPQKSRSINDEHIAPEEKDVTKVIDLFSAETGFALAEILHLLGSRLSTIVAFRVKCEIKKRILEPYCSLGSMSSWETRNNNWAGVCAGSVGAAALYLIEDNDVLAPIIYRLIGTTDCYLEGFGEDGATAEGIGYWEYGFGFFTYFAALLFQRTSGKLDLLSAEKIKRIALFPQKCYLNRNNVANFGDSPGSFRYNPGLLQYLKLRFDNVELPESRYRCGLYDDTCYRWGHFIRNLVWKGKAAGGSGDAAYFLRDVQWITSRKTGACATAFAAKGGNNAESHNHNDLGSFLLDVNGDVLLADLGAGEYTAEYFGPERYSLFPCGSQGHSVPIIEGGYQQAGAKYCAKVLSAQLAMDADLFRLDLAGAYPDDNLHSLIRSFAFEKADRQALILTDAYKFGRKPSSVTERFITLQKPETAANDTVRLNGTSGRVDILFDPKLADCHFFYTELESHRSNRPIVYIIDFELKLPGPDFEVTFSFLTKPKSAATFCNRYFGS